MAINRLNPLLFAAAALLATNSSLAQNISPQLTPPAGAIPIGTYAAKGVQVYVCSRHGDVSEWVFKAPEATLADAHGAVFARHYAGPTWEATDGSKIVGKMIQSVPSPTVGAIPWLLLSTTASGTGVLSGARYVQRIKTVGGVGATGPCPDLGAEQRVPYTAEYVIYR